MDKLLILLMVILFAVAVTSQTIFQEGGLQQDSIDMKNKTQTIIQDANTTMDNFSNGTGGTGTGN